MYTSMYLPMYICLYKEDSKIFEGKGHILPIISTMPYLIHFAPSMMLNFF